MFSHLVHLWMFFLQLNMPCLVLGMDFLLYDTMKFVIWQPHDNWGFNNVVVEPQLQPLTGESLKFRTANSDPGARLDISANGLQGERLERSFNDVWILTWVLLQTKLFSLNMKERRGGNMNRELNALNIVTTTEGMGDSTTEVYKRLPNLLSTNLTVLSWDGFIVR